MLFRSESLIIKLNGRVLDEFGNPIYNALLISENEANQYITNPDGSYDFQIRDHSTYVTVTNPGYHSVIVPISEILDGNNVITLKSDAEREDELVDLVHHKMRKNLITGSVSYVKGDQLRKSPTFRLQEGFMGRILGLGSLEQNANPSMFDESYHGLVYAEKFGKAAYITKATSQLMRDFGSIQAPMNAYLLNLGLESLHVRMQRHCENAQKVAEFLSQHEKVAWITYPGLPSDKGYELAQKYRPEGTCGVIAFGVKGGRAAAERFMKELKVAIIATHVADAHTCILHPASHTHRQMSDAQLKEAGVAPDLIRLSIGLENANDIIEDIEQALAAARNSLTV